MTAPGSPPYPASSRAHPIPGVEGVSMPGPRYRQSPVPEPEQARLVHGAPAAAHRQDMAGHGLRALTLQEAFQLLPQGLPLLLESQDLFLSLLNLRFHLREALGFLPQCQQALVLRRNGAARGATQPLRWPCHTLPWPPRAAALGPGGPCDLSPRGGASHLQPPPA